MTEDGEEGGKKGVDDEEEEGEDDEGVVGGLLVVVTFVFFVGPLAEDGDLGGGEGVRGGPTRPHTTRGRRTSMRHWLAMMVVTPRKTPTAKPVWNFLMTTVPPIARPMQRMQVQTAAKPRAEAPLPRWRSATMVAQIMQTKTRSIDVNQAYVMYNFAFPLKGKHK